MKVIYNTCLADPWIQVAQKLRDENGWEPVYWNGYHDDGSRQLVPKAFPEIIYHDYHDGWKGIFPPEVEKRYATGALDIDELNDLARFELQAMRMMDRMDPDRASFSFMERQRHFRNLLRYWSAAINWLKPDVVVSAIVPHRVFDYALYLLCQNRGIPYLSFRSSNFYARSIPLTDILRLDEVIDLTYNRLKASGQTEEELRNLLPGDVLEGLVRIKKDYAEAEPDYMKRHVNSHKQSEGIVGLSKKFIGDLRNSSELYLGEHGFLKQGMSYLKERGVSPEKSKVSVPQYAALKVKNNRYKQNLKAYYESLITEPDWEQPFVILNLHYQPEMTTNPSGDVYADQLLCVDTLSRYLPEGWLIYVKEHRAQFYAHQEGHTSRIAGFYDDLVRFPNVRLLAADTDPFTCIKKAKAVSTVTGTTGWEAMAMGKPVIIFGLTWYERYDGVLRVYDEKHAAKIPEFLRSFVFSEKNLLAYLNAFADHSIYAYTYKNQKEQLTIDEESCVNTISAQLLKMWNNAPSK